MMRIGMQTHRHTYEMKIECSFNDQFVDCYFQWADLEELWMGKTTNRFEVDASRPDPGNESSIIFFLFR